MFQLPDEFYVRSFEAEQYLSSLQKEIIRQLSTQEILNKRFEELLSSIQTVLEPPQTRKF